MHRRSWTWAFAAVALSGLLLVAPLAQRDFRGFALIARTADLKGIARRLADAEVVHVEERPVHIPWRGVVTPARVYRPGGASRQTVLLVTGLHPGGINEPRLRTLARRLAEANITVVTPEIAELSHFEISATATDRIEAAAIWLATQSGLAQDHRIGMIGASFGGGLSVVAAGRPSLHDHVRFVVSVGGHDDLGRVVAFLCDVDAGARSQLRPHDYGVAIVLLNVAADLVPPDQVDDFRAVIRRFLWASYLERTDPQAADCEFAAVRRLGATLAEPAATLVKSLSDRDVAALGRRLQPHVGDYVTQSALSPARSSPPSAPIYLLHGRGDTVIPATESRRMATRLREVTPVRLLITDLISHADADQPATLLDILRLSDFWGDVLAR